MKQFIRLSMREKNLNLSSTQRENYANEIFSKIENSDAFKSATTIALFAALPDEIPTLNTIQRWATHKRILLPRIAPNYQMEFYDYDPYNIYIGAYGIPEPQAPNPTPHQLIDLIILPGVAFTPHGDRLGRGKGYYDRYLSRPDLHATKVGICYPHQIISHIPTEPHDVKMDCVIC